jgi:UDP-N-acetylmuramoyl-tripeptide--D-alanyl-D-alanine ligase
LDLILEKIIHITNGIFLGDLPISTKINFISIDTRKILQNNSKSKDKVLFIPIKGKNFDGHDFLESAFKNGAAIALVDKKHEKKINNISNNVIIVDNTKNALQNIAAFYRRKFDIKAIGVTGSVGKSTVKEMLASIFGIELKIVKTIKNLNGQIGLPLAMFGINKETQILIAEMGISEINEMERLSEIVDPDFAIITNIGVSHLENFKTTEITCREKLKISKRENCKFYLNGDNPKLSRVNLPNEIKYFGLSGNYPYRAEQIYSTGEKTNFVLATNKFRENIEIPCLGVHNVYNALAAISVAIDAGIYLEDIKAGLERFKPLPQRGQILHVGDIIFLDDSYNASPDSVKSSINIFQAIKSDGKSIMVMADMLEIGVRSEEIHFNIGKYIALSGINILITVGNLAKFIGDGARSVDSNVEILYFINNDLALKELIFRIRSGDKILIKGSRGMKTEEILNNLVSYYHK